MIQMASRPYDLDQGWFVIIDHCPFLMTTAYLVCMPPQDNQTAAFVMFNITAFVLSE